jgi:hypothetical protein
MNNSSPSDIRSTTGKKHSLATATLHHFLLQDDDKEYFLVDGKEWPMRKLMVDVLRKFAARNIIKRSQPPYRSLGRNSTKADIMHELLLKMPVGNRSTRPMATIHQSDDGGKEMQFRQLVPISQSRLQ